MPEKDLDTRFAEAFEKASNMTVPLPQDVMLRLYAYYKQATLGMPHLSSDPDLRNAFKINAWMQVSNLSAEEAKRLYIETVDSLTK